MATGTCAPHEKAVDNARGGSSRSRLKSQVIMWRKWASRVLEEKTFAPITLEGSLPPSLTSSELIRLRVTGPVNLSHTTKRACCQDRQQRQEKSEEEKWEGLWLDNEEARLSVYMTVQEFPTEGFQKTFVTNVIVWNEKIN